MGDVKTIVAALDLETDSDAVLGRAVQLTTEHGARLVVAHVIEAPSLPVGHTSACLRLHPRCRGSRGYPFSISRRHW